MVRSAGQLLKGKEGQEGKLYTLQPPALLGRASWENLIHDAILLAIARLGAEESTSCDALAVRKMDCL